MNDMTIPPLAYMLTYKKIMDFESSFVQTKSLPCGRNFYAGPDLPGCVAGDSSCYIFMAGVVLDLKQESDELEKIVVDLKSALLDDEQKFYESIDWLAGRWILVFKRPNSQKVEIMGDATHAIKINYNEETLDCSSNIFLLSKLRNDDEPLYRSDFREHRELWQTGVIGNLSPLSGVKVLTPNHLLDLSNGKISRFFPRESLSEMDVLTVTQEICRLAKIQTELLSNKFSIFNSLTAGMDSRCSLALSFDRADDHRYFTYFRHDTPPVDNLIANEISTKLGLKHYALICGKANDFNAVNRIKNSGVIRVARDDEFIKKIREWDWYGHLSDVVVAYREMLAFVRENEGMNLPPVHIRSNLYEIGRAFWAKNGPCTAESNILKRARPRWLVFEKEFSQFYVETELNRESCFGYDLLDIFYWEHRCGTWINEVMQGTDFAFSTLSYMNCRKIICLFLSVQFSERKKASVFLSIMKNKLPDIVSDIKINS